MVLLRRSGCIDHRARGTQQCVEDVASCTETPRRECAGLQAAGWHVDVPKATMYVWAKIPEPYKKMGSLDFSKKLLADAKVAFRR